MRKLCLPALLFAAALLLFTGCAPFADALTENAFCLLLGVETDKGGQYAVTALCLNTRQQEDEPGPRYEVLAGTGGTLRAALRDAQDADGRAINEEKLRAVVFCCGGTGERELLEAARTLQRSPGAFVFGAAGSARELLQGIAENEIDAEAFLDRIAACADGCDRRCTLSGSAQNLLLGRPLFAPQLEFAQDDLCAERLLVLSKDGWTPIAGGERLRSAILLLQDRVRRLSVELHQNGQPVAAELVDPEVAVTWDEAAGEYRLRCTAGLAADWAAAGLDRRDEAVREQLQAEAARYLQDLLLQAVRHCRALYGLELPDVAGPENVRAAAGRERGEALQLRIRVRCTG